MNRIAGIFNFDGQPVAPGEIQRMLSAMDFEERAAQRTWTKGGVGLGCIRAGNGLGGHGHCLLSFSTNQQCVIVFDGRIDNRPELLSALKAQLSGSRPPASAEEIVLAAYEKWGLSCAAHLIGDFAFVVWDCNNHALVCVRDQFGVKPLYYSCSNGTFVFASTPRALLASGVVPAVVHEERIADLLMELWGGGLEAVNKTSSFFEDLFRLPPAHSLVVQAGDVTLQRYWELSPVVISGLETENDYVDAFHDLFTEAVRCRLQDSDVPASMLSGGIDSSAIVGVGRTILANGGRQPLQAFAVISNFPDTNRETSHISSVLVQGDLQPHLISETELHQRIDELVRAMEAEAEPFDCLMNLNRLIYMYAREQNVSALLDGVDGDLLLSNSFYIPPLLLQGAFRTIIAETLKANGLTAEYKMGWKLFFSGLISNITPFAPDWMRLRYRQHQNHKAVVSAIEESIIDREFATRSRLDDRFAQLNSYHIFPSRNQITAHKLDLEHPNLAAGLERYERVASAFGIEARHPFTDVRLAEFCLGLPWQLKTRHGWTKLILRRAMEPYLPPEVVWRTDKDSLMWEVNRLILKERAEYFYQITTDEQVNLKTYIDMEKLSKFWDDYLTRGDETHAESLWSGIALAMWLRQQRKIMKESQK